MDRPRRYGTAALLAVAALLAWPATPRAQPAVTYALEPPATGGLEALDRALRKLETHRRLLVVAAHPDDEDTELLAFVSQGLGGEAAYLSLTRGEGGQNLVGPDLGVGLGLVRSQELCAARRLDGARQFFTRAYDFGFTRSLDETFRKWPRQAVLEDALRVVRRFRPQVIVSIFSPAMRDTHGQHQAAAAIALDVYGAAGDPSVAPALAKEGLAPWKPAALYRETSWFDREATTVVVSTGVIDPLTGRSVYQIAMASRSLHRSQDMGTLQEPGPQETAVGWVAGGAGREGKDLFAGVDTRLSAIAAEVPDPSRRSEIERRLDRVASLAAGARRRLTPTDVSAAAAPVAEALRELRAARAGAKPEEDGGAPVLLDEKIAVAEGALAAAAGVTLDALADREVAAPEEPLEVTVSVWNAGGTAARVASVALESPEGWSVEPPAAGRDVAPGRLEEWKTRATVPRGAPATVPYFLQKPRDGDLYDWGATPAIIRGEPFQPGPLRAMVALGIAGETITLERDVSYRFRDQAIGEIRRSVRAAPTLDVAVEPKLIVWPLTPSQARHVEVALTSWSERPLRGRLEVSVPDGWSPPRQAPFAFSKRGERAFLDVPLSPPARRKAGRAPVRAAAVLEDGQRLDLGLRLLDYGYIPRTPMPERASAELVSADIRLPALRSVGYVRGAADLVPEALAAIGLPIEVLSARELDTGDLSRYDAIIVGSRAYETDPALARANPRLLDYARAGGLLVVQYQQYAFVQGGFAPFPIEIARPHDRVYDEEAPVRLLDPASPIFTTPNRIGEEDWRGWVQERGLYLARSWDSAYAPLLAIADPGGAEQRGSLLAARLGKGRYVYTGLAFFRQLPAGVPGAYRLFANLLGWK